MKGDMSPANQPKGRITARLAVFDEKRRRHIESVGGVGLPFSEPEMILEDYLHISLTRRKNPLPVFKVQLNMLRDLVTSEMAISKYKREREICETELKAEQKNKEKLEEELRIIDGQINCQRAICRAIRDIVDGIAWRLFDYDRATLLMIANRPGNKHINLQGLNAELAEFGNAYSSGDGIAVLNDLTNFLKLGDVTVRKDEGTFELVEVKTGHKSSGRITRQKQDLHRTVAFINTGKSETEDEQFSISQLNITPQTYISNFAGVTEEAAGKGAAIENIGDHLVVSCTDFERVNELGFESIKAILKKGHNCVKRWMEKGDLVINLSSQDKYIQVKRYAPFSVYRLPEKTRVKLMTGSLFFVSFVNISALLRYISERGWKLVKAPREHAEDAENSGNVDDMSLATVQKGPLSIAIPYSFSGRIAFEFLRLKTVADTLEAQLSAEPTGVEKNLYNFADEAGIWD